MFRAIMIFFLLTPGLIVSSESESDFSVDGYESYGSQFSRTSGDSIGSFSAGIVTSNDLARFRGEMLARFAEQSDRLSRLENTAAALRNVLDSVAIEAGNALNVSRNGPVVALRNSEPIDGLRGCLQDLEGRTK